MQKSVKRYCLDRDGNTWNYKNIDASPSMASTGKSEVLSLLFLMYFHVLKVHPRYLF